MAKADKSDAGVRSRWRPKLKARAAALAKAVRAAKTIPAKRAAVAAAKRVLKRHAPAVGPRLMYDSIDLSQIPPGAEAVAGYVGGKWPTFFELPARFPKAVRVSIAVASRHNAEVLDIEPGDATPAVAAGWVKRQQARGVKRPAVYCSLSAVPAVLRALADEKIGRGDIRLWTAHYTHVPHICDAHCGPGMVGTADATQYTDRALGLNLDASLCAPSFWKGR